MKNLLQIINSILDSNDKTQIDFLDESIDLRNDLDFDSFMLAELTVVIEEHTGVDIFRDGSISTISDIIQKIDD
jgi:acyl carrier protein